MKKLNKWAVVTEASQNIIDGIRSGEIKSQREINDYIYGLYAYNIASSIDSMVNTYVTCESINLPFDIE